MGRGKAVRDTVVEREDDATQEVTRNPVLKARLVAREKLLRAILSHTVVADAGDNHVVGAGQLKAHNVSGCRAG